MGVIHVENVDEKIMQAIELRARQSGRSFEEEVEAILEQASVVPLSREERVAAFRRVQDMTPKGIAQTDSTEIVRELRDKGYAGR